MAIRAAVSFKLGGDSEVPSCKLLLVDDSVTIEIKILKSILELILIQRLTKKLRELLKLLSIDSSVTVSIDFIDHIHKLGLCGVLS